MYDGDTRIVVVESQPTWSAVLGAALSGQGHRLERAGGLTEVRAALQQGPVTAVVIAGELTDGDAFEICALASADAAAPFVLIVDQQLGKPALTSELLAHLEIALRRRARPQGWDGADGDLAMLDALEHLTTSGADGTFEVFAPNQACGRVGVRKGKLVHAAVGDLDGVAAFRRLCRWTPVRIGPVFPMAEGAPLSLGTPPLGAAFFEARTTWRARAATLPPVDVVLQHRQANPPAGAEALWDLFDGQRSLLDVLDASDRSDEDSCQLIEDWLAAGRLGAVAFGAKAAPSRQSTSGVISGELMVDERAPSARQRKFEQERQSPSVSLAQEQVPATAPPLPDPPPSTRSLVEEDLLVEPPPRRPIVLPIGVGLLLGAAAAFLLWAREDGNAGRPAGERPGAAPVQAARLVPTAPVPVIAPLRPPAPPVPPAAPAPGPPAAEEAEACRRAYAHAGKRQTVELCERALAVAPEQPDLITILAHVELERGNYRRARSWTRKAIALDPGRAEPYAYLGFLDDQDGRRDRALRAYRTYLHRAPFGRYAADIRLIVSEPAPE